MKMQTFLFLCLCFNQFMSIKSFGGAFVYWNGYEFWNDDTFCGSKKEQFSNDYGDKYCCVHQNSPSVNNCQIDSLANVMWCPNATLLSFSHISTFHIVSCHKIVSQQTVVKKLFGSRQAVIW